ncbi:MAG TPA: hypothetical protein V6C97_24190 [Oculatellaceae cyanobacterium]
MTTAAAKVIRWAEIGDQEKAKQFHDRGIERTARSDTRSNCVFCEKLIREGEHYLDVNGARYAHKSCVVSNSNGLATDRKVITNKMREELSAKKSAPTEEAAPKRRPGRPPKSESTNVPNTKKQRGAKSAALSVAKPSKRGPKAKGQWAKVLEKMREKEESGLLADVAPPKKRGPKPKSTTLKTASAVNRNGKSGQSSTVKLSSKRGLKPKSQSANRNSETTKTNRTAKGAAEIVSKPSTRGRKPKSADAATPVLKLSEVREALPGAIVTLTITGTVEAVQRALDKLQN